MTQYTSGNCQLGDGKASERVVAAVAAARDEDPLELPPLYSAIDPDALDQLFDHGLSGGRSGPGRVVFMLAGCKVVVHSDGKVDVTAPSEQTPASSAADPTEKQDEAEMTLD